MSLPWIPQVGATFTDNRDPKKPYHLRFKKWDNSGDIPPKLYFDGWDGEDGFDADMQYWIFNNGIESGEIVPA